MTLKRTLLKGFDDLSNSSSFKLMLGSKNLVNDIVVEVQKEDLEAARYYLENNLDDNLRLTNTNLVVKSAEFVQDECDTAYELNVYDALKKQIDKDKVTE